MSEIKSKSPRTIEVKLLVPYAIIVVMVISLGGLIAGWNIRGDVEVHTKAAAKEMVTTLSPKEQK